jgi:ParB-like chromosome segregation protein Spo0J
VKVRLDQIKVGSRIRKDLGDIGELARSMEALGQLQPILVTQDHKLMAGYRRLLAAKQLGWEFIDAAYYERLADAAALLRAESAENQCRMQFLPSEAIAMEMAIEEAEQAAAKKRQQIHGNTAKGRVRDKIGSAIGLSGTIYQRGKAVLLAAQENPEKYGRYVEEMDDKGVTTAYKGLNPAFGKVRDRKMREERLAAPTDLTALEWPEVLSRFIADAKNHLTPYADMGLLSALRDGVVIWPPDKQQILDIWQDIIDSARRARPRLEVVE